MKNVRETMELNIEDPAFGLMRLQFNGALHRVIDSMEIKDVDESTVTMKVKIQKEMKAIENREPAQVLNISYKISSQLVLKEDTDGDLPEIKEFEMEFDDRGHLIMQRIYDPQHKIDEYM